MTFIDQEMNNNNNNLIPFSKIAQSISWQQPLAIGNFLTAAVHKEEKGVVLVTCYFSYTQKCLFKALEI